MNIFLWRDNAKIMTINNTYKNKFGFDQNPDKYRLNTKLSVTSLSIIDYTNKLFFH